MSVQMSWRMMSSNIPAFHLIGVPFKGGCPDSFIHYPSIVLLSKHEMPPSSPAKGVPRIWSFVAGGVERVAEICAFRVRQKFTMQHNRHKKMLV
jgi:hypothetical protein